MKKSLLTLGLTIFTMSASASTIGVSAHPFTMKKHIFTTEVGSYLSNGSGTGITAKYFQRVNDKVNFDAGFGITDGDRASRMFMGADVEVTPDYGRQPRFSVKGFLETEKIDDDRVNSFGAAPTLSKGFSFWGNEAFPFVSLPVKISLNDNTSKYETVTALATGITGRLPVAGMRDLTGNVEANFSLRNGYTALVMGLSLPIQ